MRKLPLLPNNHPVFLRVCLPPVLSVARNVNCVLRIKSLFSWSIFQDNVERRIHS